MSNVTIYTAPFCPYCTQAVRLLKSKKIDFTEIDTSAKPALRKEMMDKSKRNTVPQIFNGDKHIGDCTELFTLEQQGKLDGLLA